MSFLFDKSKLLMKEKGSAGGIPKDVWNALVETVYALAIQSVEGGKLVRYKGGTSLSIDRPAPAGGGRDCALVPQFGKDDNNAVIVYFEPQTMLFPGGKEGMYAEVVPKFEGEDIYSEDEEWTRPEKVLSNAEYFVWLKVKGAGADLIVGEEADEPSAEPGLKIYKLAKFTVAAGANGSIVQDKVMYHCPQFVSEDPGKHEGFPHVYNTGDAENPSWVVKFTDVFVFDGENGTSTRASNNDTEHPCAAGDKFYLHHETDDAKGITTNFEIHKAQSQPEGTPHSRIEEKAGNYYVELCEIKEGLNGALYAEIKRSAGLTWHSNQDHGVNAADQPTDGAQLYIEEKKYPYKWRVLNPGPLPLSQSSAGVGLKWEQDGTSITPKLSTQGASGTLSLAICDGGGSFSLRVEDGMVVEMSSGDLEAAPCDTTPPGP